MMRNAHLAHPSSASARYPGPAIATVLLTVLLAAAIQRVRAPSCDGERESWERAPSPEPVAASQGLEWPSAEERQRQAPQPTLV